MGSYKRKIEETLKYGGDQLLLQGGHHPELGLDFYVNTFKQIKKEFPKIIKEIRGMLGLGLKEAKEMVESAPCWIKKELVKNEADGLKEKLEGLGAKIRLA